MGEELKPCPFCGGKSSVDNGSVGCDNCGIWTVKFVDVSIPINYWNTRPLEEQAERDRLIAASGLGRHISNPCLGPGCMYCDEDEQEA
jgi:hypothetical protein